MAIANRGLRFGLNAWVERSAELSRRRALLRSVTPEARAMRKGFNSWCAMLDAYAHLLYATAALRHREVFVALNTWRSYARERRVWSARIGGALKALSPEGRAMRRGLNSWRRMVEERAMMRKVTTARALPFPLPLAPHLSPHALFTTARAAGASRPCLHHASRHPSLTT